MVYIHCIINLEYEKLIIHIIIIYDIIQSINDSLSLENGLE